MKKIILLFILTSCASEEVIVASPENTSENSSAIEIKKLNYNRVQSFELKTKLSGHPDLVNECNQLINIYCMKDKHSKRFNSENKCLTYVSSTLNKCENNKKKITKETISCLKKNLSLR